MDLKKFFLCRPQYSRKGAKLFGQYSGDVLSDLSDSKAHEKPVERDRFTPFNGLEQQRRGSVGEAFQGQQLFFREVIEVARLRTNPRSTSWATVFLPIPSMSNALLEAKCSMAPLSCATQTVCPVQ